MSGSLTIVGTGITAISQFTREAEHCLTSADKVFYLVTDSFTEEYIKKLNDAAESLKDHYQYGTGKHRIDAYHDMVETILTPVRKGLSVCVAFYGHPGVFVYPSHEAIIKARKSGYAAKMIPGVSAEDMLACDLGLDPASPGFQTYEATAFFLLAPQFDPRIPLVLWQIGVVGNPTPEPEPTRKYVEALVDVLVEHYSPDHHVVLYQASQYENVAPQIHICRLCELSGEAITPLTTLYVPPCDVITANSKRTKVFGARADDFSVVSRQKSIDRQKEPYAIPYPEKEGYVTYSQSLQRQIKYGT